MECLIGTVRWRTRNQKNQTEDGEKFFHVFSYNKKGFFLQKPIHQTYSTVTDVVGTVIIFCPIFISIPEELRFYIIPIKRSKLRITNV